MALKFNWQSGKEGENRSSAFMALQPTPDSGIAWLRLSLRITGSLPWISEGEDSQINLLQDIQYSTIAKIS
jgi:hypothetical protein